jgi:hypothetical protein
VKNGCGGPTAKAQPLSPNSRKFQILARFNNAHTHAQARQDGARKVARGRWYCWSHSGYLRCHPENLRPTTTIHATDNAASAEAVTGTA